jgi:hypothetical protein
MLPRPRPFGGAACRSFLVAVNLFGLGAAFSLYNGVHGLLAGRELPQPGFALIDLALAAGFEGLALRTAWRQFVARRPPGAVCAERSGVQGPRAVYRGRRGPRGDLRAAAAAERPTAMDGV